MSNDNFDITSSNAEAILTVASLYPNGIALEGFSVDSSVSVENITVAETRMGVDGKMVAGYTPAIIPVTIGLEPNVQCARDLLNVWLAMQANNKIYECTLVLTIPSINRVYTFLKGVLKSCTPVPALKKVLDPTTWAFDFERINPQIMN